MGEHSSIDELVRLPLPQIANNHAPYFEANEAVMLCPSIFKAMCQNFGVEPRLDIFASRNLRQLPHYITADEMDSQADGYNAFNYFWAPDVVLYANPPWSLIQQVLEKIKRDRSRVLLVTPMWRHADWFETLRGLSAERLYWNQSLYLSDEGRLRPAPPWPTRLTWIDATVL